MEIPVDFFPLLFKKLRKAWKIALTFHSHLIEKYVKYVKSYVFTCIP